MTYDQETNISPIVELLKSIWEGKKGNWSNIDKESEQKLNEILSTNDFRLHAVQILELLIRDNRDNSNVASAVQTITYAILKDLKSGQVEAEELDNWSYIPNHGTVLEFIFELLPSIEAYLVSAYGPNALPEKRFILYESLVVILSTFIMRSNTKYFEKFEAAILKYICSDELSQVLLAVDIWVLLLRGNENLRIPHIIHLAKQLCTDFDGKKYFRLSLFIKRAYFYLSDDEKVEVKNKLMPLKQKLPWIFVELTPQERKIELQSILSKCKNGSRINILDIHCACYIIGHCPEYTKDSREVKEIVNFIFSYKKNLIEKPPSQKFLKLVVNDSFRLVSKFISLQTLDDFISLYLAQQKKDDINFMAEGSILDDKDEQMFVANVFYENILRIAKSSSFSELIIAKTHQIRWKSPMAQSIWLEIWSIFCRATTWPNIIRKLFSFDSRSAPLEFDKRRTFHNYLNNTPALSERELFSELNSHFKSIRKIKSYDDVEMIEQSKNDVKSHHLAPKIEEYEPPVKKKKVLSINQSGKLVAESFDDLLNQHLIRLNEGCSFLFNASDLPKKCESSVYQSIEKLQSVIAKHWPVNPPVEEVNNVHDVVEID